MNSLFQKKLLALYLVGFAVLVAGSHAITKARLGIVHEATSPQVSFKAVVGPQIPVFGQNSMRT